MFCSVEDYFGVTGMSEKSAHAFLVNFASDSQFEHPGGFKAPPRVDFRGQKKIKKLFILEAQVEIFFLILFYYYF